MYRSDKKNSYKVFVVKPEGVRPLVRSMRIWEENTMEFEETRCCVVLCCVMLCYVKVLSLHVHGRIQKNHENPRSW